MSAENQEAHSSSDALPFRDGAFNPAEIRRQCPQFRILVIGKANAGKTTILSKVCNAEPDAKPIIYNAKGKKVKRDLADVCHGNLAV
jgi:septin family protein